jgi:O-antigen/teichoic acid export membrane protein
MVTTTIFTRLLNTSEYGQFGVFNSWLGIVNIFVSLNLSYGVYTQGLIKFDKERNVFSSSLQGLTLTLVSVWTIIYLLFHNFWNQLFSLTTVQMLAMLVMIWTTSVFNFWAREQRVFYKYKQLVILTLITSVAKTIVGIFSVTHSADKVTAYILSLVIVELIAYTWLFFNQMSRGKVFFSKIFWRYALFFNIPLVPHYLSQTVLNSADRIMIQNMVGYSKAGIYNLSYSLSLIMTLFNTALTQTLSPWLYQKIKDKREKEIAPVAYTTLIFIASVNIMLILLAPEAVAIFAPKEYYEAIWIIPPVAMSVFFMYSYDLFAKFAFYYEKTNFLMIASVLGAALNVFLNYIYIQRFGYIAAGYTTLVCYIFYTVAHYLFMRKVCRQYCDGEYPYETRKILIIAITFLMIGFGLMLTYNYPIVRYGILFLIVIVLFIKRKQITERIKHTLLG